MIRNITVGLTGSEGSDINSIGKSFESLKIKVFNADLQLKWLLNYDQSVVESVKKNFGTAYTISNFLNPIAFDTDEKFDKLLDLVEYLIFKSFNEFVERNKEKCYVIFLSSLIFERNWRNRFDYNINVFRPKKERIEDFRRVHDYDVSYCDNLFENELDELDKNLSSDFVIHNYLGEKQLRKQIINCDLSILDFYYSEKVENKLSKSVEIVRSFNDI